MEILATLLHNPTLLDEYRKQLNPDMFFDYANLYRLMIEVEEAEGLTFRGLAKRINNPERVRILHEIRAQYISDHRMQFLIPVVKKRLLREKLYSLSTKMADDSTDPDELLRDMQHEIDKLSASDSGEIEDMTDHVDRFMDELETVRKNPALAMGMLTGIRELDGITKGFRKHDLIVIGARTSMGKSAFQIELALLLTKAGYKGAIFSLEMSRKQIYKRMVANVTQTSLEKINMGDISDYDMGIIRTKAELLKSIYIDETRGVSADYITDSMRALKRTQGLDFVMVDYLQDVRESGESNDNSGSALARVCRKLRTGAQQNDCAVFGLSQVARASEKQADKRPTNADLSGSTGIETAADVIALLYREDYYNPDTDKKDILEVNFTKSRNGALGKVELTYDKRFQKIYSRW